MNLKLTGEEILFIDSYLQFIGVKFMDVRIELIDHLASEYENRKVSITLEDFIRKKRPFVRDFEKKLHSQKHWGCQKALMHRILKFVYVPQYVLATLVVIIIVFCSTYYLTSTIIDFLFYFTIIPSQIFQYYVYYRPKGLHKKVQSFQYILSLMSGPALFFYFFGIVSEWLHENPIYFAVYWILALICNLAGVIEILKCKEKIVLAYNQMIKA